MWSDCFHRDKVHIKDTSSMLYNVIVKTKMDLTRTVPPCCLRLRSSTDCLSDNSKLHSSPLCRGHCAPPACYHAAEELNHPFVHLYVRACVCIREKETENAVCVQKKTLWLSHRGYTSRQRWLSFRSPGGSLLLLICLNLFIPHWKMLTQ